VTRVKPRLLSIIHVVSQQWAKSSSRTSGDH
jgi:hypothetical protein